MYLASSFVSVHGRAVPGHVVLFTLLIHQTVIIELYSVPVQVPVPVLELDEIFVSTTFLVATQMYSTGTLQ
jgi:hypothetical protein